MSGGLSTITARELGARQFEPLRWAIPELLPEGLAILAGRPKYGKSFLALDFAVAVASGGRALQSVQCEAGAALYLALEDGERRLQDRIKRLVAFGDELPTSLHLATTARRLRGGLEDDLEQWLAGAERPRLAVIDTLARVRPEATGRGSAYEEDARALAGLHDLSRRWPGVAIVIVHHVRKAESEDVFADISGTYGLTGIADTLLILGPHGNGARLSGQGRDVDGFEKALTRDGFTGGWRLDGDARALAKTLERQAVLDVLDEAEGEVLTASRIGAAVGKKPATLSHLLKRLAEDGLIEKAGYGKYRARDPLKVSKASKVYAPPPGDSFDTFDSFDGVSA
jgi:DNA-binding transcriptional ArsR family regulator